MERKQKSNYKTGNLLGTISHLACYHNMLKTGHQTPVHLSVYDTIHINLGQHVLEMLHLV